MHTALAKIAQELHKLQAHVGSSHDLVTRPADASAAAVLEDNRPPLPPPPSRSPPTANINTFLMNSGNASKPRHALPTMAGEFYAHCTSKGGSVPSMHPESLYKAEFYFKV
ncbi:hypothetical protein CYMTET_35025 [Cymbomonas tetramitiformis]|uniref:Uncharacterized protein n=1 Tax=Cymbomonas tetramitiformis TaxID=36881 RepID=A0AAE0KPD4_9CHLO|nr:hypothetical protein CYMTET_35025 [Cymbomonas tetramitiformis]